VPSGDPSMRAGTILDIIRVRQHLATRHAMPTGIAAKQLTDNYASRTRLPMHSNSVGPIDARKNRVSRVLPIRRLGHKFSATLERNRSKVAGHAHRDQGLTLGVDEFQHESQRSGKDSALGRLYDTL
jgi:hypothetical protein